MTSDGTSQTPSPVTSNVPKSNTQILGGRKYLDECMNLLKGSTRTCVHGRECLSCQECCSSLAAMVAKPFECPECPRAFSSTAALQTHVQSHGADRPYSCTECPKAFTQLSALQVHRRTHSGEKPYSCSQCGKRFTQISALQVNSFRALMDLLENNNCEL
ncbi:unnamed protein product [Timema podura]|uniref:C2H2-type domain-containing protein n=1 Tax=Timema podura TaxID=61482 RepID=A0ABN7NU04_TIMPD|nr:unnamed protein product [Timema podura]